MEDTFIRDLSNSVKNGLLHMQDPIDKTWAKHYFVLTNEKLFFTDQQEKEDDAAAKDDEPDVSSFLFPIISLLLSFSLLYSRIFA